MRRHPRPSETTARRTAAAVLVVLTALASLAPVALHEHTLAPQTLGTDVACVATHDEGREGSGPIAARFAAGEERHGHDCVACHLNRVRTLLRSPIAPIASLRPVAATSVALADAVLAGEHAAVEARGPPVRTA
ncbi:MAG: hypothetical protein DWQ36_10720 [Acidobacteria bacterium]|nr:MAG: hypothetical protein DWQ30_12685 [Acidobacteriota bacterium]REK07685.1 MAG: hypothetical protein DWQ36_10720 [Acidobacteriota bacterium]